MANEAGYLLVVSMDVQADKEELFNQVYDEHAEHLLTVPGVRSISRLKGEPFNFAMAGEVKQMAAPNPVYIATYEVDTPDVPASDAWAEAVEKGRWASEVRPFTSNRTHAFYKKLETTL